MTHGPALRARTGEPGSRPPTPSGSRRTTRPRFPRSEPLVNVSVMQENLARGLSVVSRAVSSRSTLPVLGNVLIRTEDGGLKLTATNLEIGITYWVPARSTSTARSRSRPSCWPTSSRACRPASGSTSSSRRATRCGSGPGGSRPTSRASTPRSSRRSRPRASGRRPGSPRRCSARHSTRRRSPPPATRRGRS